MSKVVVAVTPVSNQLLDFLGVFDSVETAGKLLLEAGCAATKSPLHFNMTEKFQEWVDKNVDIAPAHIYSTCLRIDEMQVFLMEVDVNRIVKGSDDD